MKEVRIQELYLWVRAGTDIDGVAAAYHKK